MSLVGEREPARGHVQGERLPIFSSKAAVQPLVRPAPARPPASPALVQPQ